MSEPMEIYVDTYQMLGYDLAAAVAEYTAKLAAFALTEGVPAPAATSVVEGIVKHHDGKFVIVPSPTVVEPQALPMDVKFYRSVAEQAKIMSDVVKGTATDDQL